MIDFRNLILDYILIIYYILNYINRLKKKIYINILIDDGKVDDKS